MSPDQAFTPPKEAGSRRSAIPVDRATRLLSLFLGLVGACYRPEWPSSHDEGTSPTGDAPLVTTSPDSGSTAGPATGATTGLDPTSSTTRAEPACGNGVVEGPEECDDGNAVNHDDCSNWCHHNIGTGCTFNPEILTQVVYCDPGLYCVADGICGGCAELPAKMLSCADVNELTPVCAENGACAQCTLEDPQTCPERLVCDPQTLTCGVCRTHGQCPSGICLRSTLEDGGTGFCLPQSDLFWVSNQADCKEADGSEGHPFCSIAAALAAAPNVHDFGILLKGSPDPYTPIPFPSGNYPLYLAVVGASVLPEEYPTFTVLDSESPIVALPDAGGRSLLLARVQLTGSTFAAGTPMVRCEGNSNGIAFDQLRIEGNESKGGPLIDMKTGCHIQIEESVITGNSADVLVNCEDQYSGFWMFNTFVTDNLTTTAPVLTKGAAALRYTTIVANDGDYTSTVACTGEGTLVARNSLILGASKPLSRAARP